MRGFGGLELEQSLKSFERFLKMLKTEVIFRPKVETCIMQAKNGEPPKNGWEWGEGSMCTF